MFAQENRHGIDRTGARGVADALDARGFSNKAFVAELREGKRDDSPYMVGALAWAEREQAWKTK